MCNLELIIVNIVLIGYVKIIFRVFLNIIFIFKKCFKSIRNLFIVFEKSKNYKIFILLVCILLVLLIFIIKMKDIVFGR